MDARNSLESYAYNLKNQINDEDGSECKLDSDDKDTIQAVMHKSVEWLDVDSDSNTNKYKENLQSLKAFATELCRNFSLSPIKKVKRTTLETTKHTMNCNLVAYTTCNLMT